MARYPAQLALTLILAGQTAVSSQPQKANPTGDFDVQLNGLVRERGERSDLKNGILHVVRNGGWLRTRRIVSDFTLKTEFRLPSSNSELQVGLRTINTPSEWPSRGYRLKVSSRTPAAVVADGYRMTQTKSGEAVTVADAEWHSLTIEAVGRSIAIVLDGRSVGTYEIEVPSGAILFQASQGDAELRTLFLSYPPAFSSIAPVSAYKGQKLFVAPTLEREVKPNYGPTALAEKVEGVVHLEAIVEQDGSVGAVQLTKLLHPELEHSSLDAIRKWKFKAATLNGSPVATLIEIEMSYSLRR